MKNAKFEKRRKAVEGIFDCIFWFYLIEIIVSIGFKVAYGIGKASVDIFDLKSYIILLIGLCFMFFSSRLAHKGHIAAGIIGMIVGLIQFFFGKVFGVIIGLILLIDSIMYLLCFEKK